MSQILRSPMNTPSGAGNRFWQDEDFQRYCERFLTEGVDTINTSGALLVEENSGGADMSVDIAVGFCLVEMTRNARTFKPWCENTASDNLAIGSNSSGSTRIDLICMKIDVAVDADTAATNVASLIVVVGTPGAGIPSTPANHLSLAEITVANGETQIDTVDITDKRVAITTLLVPAVTTTKWIPDILDNALSFKIDLANMPIVVTGTSFRDLYGMGVFLETGTTIGNYIYYQEGGPIISQHDLGDDMSGYFPIMLGTNSSQDIFFGLVGSFGAPPANATTNLVHIGFFVEDGTVYVSNASGSGQTKTDITSDISIFGLNTYSFIRTGSSIAFYANGVLAATHTTNLPTGNAKPYLGIETQTGSLRRLHVFNSVWFTNNTDPI